MALRVALAAASLAVIACGASPTGDLARPPKAQRTGPPPAPPSAAQVDGGCPSGMASIPAGTFSMGSDDGDPDERPVHAVDVAGLCMDLTEVTVAAYGACVASGGCAPAPTTIAWSGASADAVKLWSQLCHGDRWDRQDHPVNCVDADQAGAYCANQGKRLPTEEEWEYAARGTEGTKYPWGDAAPGPTLLNACGGECRALGEELGERWIVMYEGDDGWGATAPVGGYPGGRSRSGIFDMAGNVWEWTSSQYSASYSEGRTDADRVYRGVGWNSDDASRARGAYRSSRAPSSRSAYIGFRCARGEARAPS